MGNIFDINTLLCENTLADELLVKPFPNETYIFSAIKSIRGFNENLLLFNKTLYKSLNEASSKAEENLIFGDFYNKYSTILDNYINEINTMVGRFNITLDNLVDANMSLVNDQDVLGCTKSVSFNVKKYKNLCGGKYPKFDPMSIYQSEFDFIGQLMQDLGPIATDIAKIEVISSVLNTFNNKLKNKWLEKCIEDITGEDDCEDLSSYANIVMKLFVEDNDENTIINKGTIYAMREEIIGYEKYKDAINRISVKLINDFTYISKNIGSLFYRNKDNILELRSKTNNVQNRDYQLNTYGMNQLDLFMKSKVNQVSQMCSLYVIALSIMMDNIINYITQCKEMLEAVKDICNDSSDSVTQEPNQLDDNVEPNDNEGDLETEEPDDAEHNEADNIEDEEIPEDNIDIDDKDLSSEGNKTSSFNLSSEFDNNDDQEPDLDSDEPIKADLPKDEFANEAYLFEYFMYNLDNIDLQESLVDYVITQVLREDVTSTIDKYKDSATLIDKIVLKFNELWNKFTNSFQTQTSKMSEFMGKASFDGCKFEFSNDQTQNDDGKVKVTTYEKLDQLDATEVVPFNYEQMKQYLSNEKTFVDQYYKDIARNMGEGISIGEAMEMMHINSKVMVPVSQANINTLISYVADFKKVYSKLQGDVQDVKRASILAKTIAKQVGNTQNQSSSNTSSTTSSSSNTNNSTTSNNNSSTTSSSGSSNTAVATNASYMTTADMYFNEDVEVPKGDAANNSGNPLAQVRLYFNVVTKIACKKMSISQRVFNDYFKALNAILKLNGKPYYGAGGSNNDNNKKKG